MAVLLALGASALRPGDAQAFSFICPYLDYLEAAYPDANNPAPPNGVNPCSGTVDDQAPAAPGEGEGEDVWFDAFIPEDAVDPTDEFSDLEYGAGIQVGPEQDEFPAPPEVGEMLDPHTLVYRMLFHVTNPPSSGNPGGEEPPVSYTIDFGLPARLQLSPTIVAGPVENAGSVSSQDFTVTNVSNDTAVKVTGVVLGEGGAGSYKVEGCLDITLQPGQTCKITLTFIPAAAGESPVSITVSGDDGSKARVKGVQTAVNSGDGGTGQAGGGSGGGAGTSGAKPPCDCSKVSAFANDFGVYHDSTRLTFKLNTTVLCSAGSGLTCKGKASLLAPKGMFFVTPPVKGAKGPHRERTMHVECKSICGKSRTEKATFTLLALNVRNPALLPKGRGAKEARPLEMVLQTNCISPTGLVRAADRKVLKIAFLPNGNVDYKQSDLNGDRKPDGAQLK